LLSSVRRRWRAEASLRAVGRGSLLAACPILAGAGLSAWLAPGDRALVALALAMSLGVLVAVATTAWRFGRTPADYQVARFVEERAAARGDVAPLDDVVVSAVSGPARLGNDGLPPAEPAPFLDLVVASAVRRLEIIGAAGIVSAQALRRAGAEALAGTAVLAVAVVLAWPMQARASEAAWITLVPQSIHVEVLPGDTRIPAGKPLTIRASVRAGSTLLTRFTPVLTVESVSPDRSDVRRVTMTPDGGGFQFSFESVDRTFRYRVTAGSRQSEDYTVTALMAPRVTRIDLRYEYPAFTSLAPRDERDGGDIYAPAGTKVRVRVHTDKPIASGQLVFAQRIPGMKDATNPESRQEPGGLQLVADQVLEGELVLARDDSYRIGLTDRDGLRSPGETEYFLRVMDDRPPDVRILRPAADQQITPLEEVAIEARAEDDYGISRFELVYAVAGREPKVVRFERSTGSTLARAGNHTIAAEDLRVQPGDVITYYARARDVARGKRATETRSDIFFLEVRPFSEEFVLAQSQAMSGMASEQIETLIAAQKEIINATWNIERRAASGAGRSSDDITAIATAQTELKTRAEEIASRTGRGRGAIRFPQQILPPGPFGGAQGRQGQGRPPSDPVGAAISAMTRAIDQLEGQRTSQALPHEMAALQGLVQAQAEVRRREVAQQAGASMGGLGRQGQDLSALFDKELQRQQRTNYETRSQTESRPDRQESETALDKIRDLARRQEELSRRQRELAKAVQPADELKRQLEKLSREQEALRQQAEELAREMGQQAAGQQPGQPAGQPQRAGSSPSQSGAGSAVREAAGEMRNAAGELQRQSPSTAADRGDRAAAELRRLEQQMRRDNPDARQQAVGEARLDAQQIADEQRRIAGEASRLSKGADAANRDAWRRLAGEKEKLADRVDELQRSVEQLGGDPAPGSAGQAATAAKEIARQQIAGRMRDGAKRMRETADAELAAGGRAARPTPSQPPAQPPLQPPLQQRAAEAEQQLAKALEQIVGQLGGGAAGAEDLSRQLDESRAIRDRLDRLERQIREADAQNAAGRQGQGRNGTPSAGRSATPGSSPGSGQSPVPSPDPREDAQRLREEYAKALQSARTSLSRLERGSPGTGIGGASPEEHQWSAVDQGTEAFKQDFAQWESLRKDVDSALERYEASVIARAARRGLPDRLSAGGSDRAPDDYRQVIARYYESLAKKK
jgi:hypothetical protein